MTAQSPEAAPATCDRCGEENAASARFCSTCGARLGAADARQEERKLVSVLFVDLEGFTATSDRADPEDVREMLEDYYTSAKECIEQYGGTVDKFIGDAVMAVFGAPASRGDDAERAVRAGLEVLRRVALLELPARAAVNTGEAVVRVGDQSSGEAIALGDVVNTASRLQTHATTGRLLVGDETYRATRHAIRYVGQTPFSAKGKADPIQAWLAVEPLGDPAERPVTFAPFVGRRRELEVIRSVWEQAIAESRPHVVTMLGSLGVGKSRLCREVSALVEADGGQVLRGRCLPYEEQTGYYAFAQVVRQVSGIFDSDSPAVARSKLAETVQALLPDEASSRIKDLALLLGLGTDELVDDQRLLFFSARRFVERVGEEQPTLVVFEDIHWGAPSELDLLEYLGAHVRDTRAVFVALARPELLDTRPSWGGGGAAHTRIPLDPLGSELAAEMAALLLAPGTDEAAVARLVDVAEGNPLFIEELAAALAEGGRTDELPVTVRAAIASRVDALPSDSRAALLSAAVVGRTFWQEVLQSVSGIDDLHTVLEDLERRDLIRREPTSRLEGDVEFRFKHALIRDVAYGTLPRATRRERHAATARFVEARTEGAETVAWVLAHHWREAGEPEKAVPHLLAAAEVAQKAWATEAAVDLYSKAIELAEDDSSRALIRLRRGIALVTLEEHERALQDLAENLDKVEGSDLLDALLFGGNAYVWTERHEQALDLAQRATQLAAELGDRERQVAATALLSQALAARGDEGDIERAIALGDEANDRWKRGSRGYEHANHLHLHGELLYWTGNYDRSMELGTAAHELGGDVNSPEAVLRGGGLRAMAMTGLGRHEEALATLGVMVDVARELGRDTSYLLNYTSMVYRELLDLAVARTQTEEALEYALGLSFGMPRRFAQSDLLFTALLEGDIGGAGLEWPKLWEDANEATGWTRWLILGRLATAKAEIALRTGDDDAEEWAARAVAVTSRTRRRKYEARARELHGQVLVELGRVDEGLSELRAAVAIADALVNPPGRWAARAALTRVLYATGDDNGAAQANGEAGEIVRAFASSLSPGRAAALLEAPPLREILIV